LIGIRQPSALLRIDVRFVLRDFARLGLDPASARLVVVKSGYLSPELAPIANPAIMALSPGAVAELETDFDDVEQELRTFADEQLRGHVEGWGFERRQGLIAEELVAAANDIRAAHPDATVVIVVGSSSQVMHRVVGSVAVGLARHSPVPLVVVP